MRPAVVAALVAAAVLLLPLLFGWVYFETDLSFIDVGHLCALERDPRFGGGAVSALIGNGAPRLAHPSFQLLYPPRWLARLFEPAFAAALFAALHLVVGAAATARLARSYSLPPRIAALAGLMFTLSGPVLELLSKSEYKVAAAWLPLAWVSVRCLLKGGGPAWIVAGAAAYVLLLLGGDPQAFGLAIGLAVVEIVAAAWRSRGDPRRGRAFKLRGPPVLGLILVGLGVGWVQWAPTLVEAGLSRRAGGFTSSEAMVWAFEPSTWAAVVLPGLLRTLVEPGVYLQEVWAGAVGPAGPWSTRPYLGGAFLVAAVVGALVWKRRAPAVVAFGGLLMALGPLTPVLPAMVAGLPLLDRFRYPAKYLVVVTLAASLLAAAGFDRAARHKAARRGMLAGLLVVLVTAAVFLATAGQWGPALDAAAAATLGAGGPVTGLSPASEHVRGALFALSLPVAAAALALSHPRARRWVGVVAVLELLAATPLHVEAGPPLTRIPGPLRSLNDDEAGLPPVVCVPDTVAAIAVDHPVEGPVWSSMLARRVWGFPEWPACDGAATPVTYTDPLRTRTAQGLYDAVARARAPAAIALGCSHVVEHDAPWPESIGPRVALPVDEALPGALKPRVRLVRDRLPLAFVVERPRLHDEEGVVRAVLSAPDRGAVTAVVDDPLSRLGDETLDEGGARVRSSRAEARDHFVVELAGEGPALVGLRTSFYAGWTAEQAGEELPVVRVAGALVGAPTDDAAAGPITFRYRSPRAWQGWLSGPLAVLLFAFLWLWARVVRRQTSRRPLAPSDPPPESP